MRKFIYITMMILCANAVFASDTYTTILTDPSGKEYNNNPLFHDYADSSNVLLPKNLFSSYRFSNGTSGYIRPLLYILGPLGMTLWGVAEWDWGTSKGFSFYPQSPWGTHAVDGGVDKLGHMFGTYMMKQTFSFMLRSAGYSKTRATWEGALMAEITQLVTEIGDGFSTIYGFDPYDLLFNNIGILLGIVFDYFPTVDRLFSVQWEYVPTRQFREDLDWKLSEIDIMTDYSGQKFFLATKLGGIPYLSQTPLRYINIDLGFYSRGYKPRRYYNYRRQFVHIGFSVNFVIAFGDLLPTGYFSSSLLRALGYVHLPCDVESKKITLIQKRNIPGVKN